MIKSLSALLTLVAVALPLNTSAADVIIERQLEPVKTAIAGHNIDYFNLVPGISPQEWTATAKQQFPNSKMSVQENELSGPDASSVIHSQKYISEIVARRTENSEEMRLRGSFSAISSGNQLIGLDQSIVYGLKFDAPRTDQVANMIGNRFGEASQVEVSGDKLLMVWAYSNGAQLHCDNINPCPLPDTTYSTGQLVYYMTIPPVDYLISVEIVRRADAPTLLASFTLKMLDLKKRAEAAKFDLAAQRALATAAHDKERQRLIRLTDHRHEKI